MDRAVLPRPGSCGPQSFKVTVGEMCKRVAPSCSWTWPTTVLNALSTEISQGQQAPRGVTSTERRQEHEVVKGCA